MGADDDAAWSADGSLRLQLPPCEGPLVLLHLLSTAGAAAAGEHAADELLATAALLALPEQAACSEVNRLFEVMQQKLEPAGQSQSDGSALAAAPLVFNSQLRAFVMDYGHLLAPGRRASPQLTRHLQTFLALQDMHSCLQLLRSAGVTVSSAGSGSRRSSISSDTGTHSGGHPAAASAASGAVIAPHANAWSTTFAAPAPAASASALLAVRPAQAAGPADGWHALMALVLRGFTPAPREQAYQQWRQHRVATLAALALWVQSTLVLLPAAAFNVYVLLWLRDGVLAALALPVLQSLLSHVPAFAYWCRPELYVRHHDPVWALTATFQALATAACSSFGVMTLLKEAGPGSLLRNMLMPAILVYTLMPALLQLSTGWQLLLSVSAYLHISAITTIAAKGASIESPAHVALVALSVVIASVMEWRSRALWLRASGAAAAADPGVAGAMPSAAAAQSASAKPAATA
jgi:hypothetical protein